MSGMQELRNTLQELTEQYQGLDAIPGLGAEEKHAVMTDTYQQSMTPLLATFESLQDENSRPESNHERWFISTFRDRIQAALDSLRSPKTWDNLFEGLNMLRDIGVDIGKELSGARVLQLSDLSPDLANIQSSLIDIPSPKQGTGVTIQSFEQQVVIIPTKTKPKKLTLIGCDGKRYTYLFKGLEDLHLDERVMQLLRITNGMLRRDKDSCSRELIARHYAVVPLSDSSGMIQWVENTVSIYTIIAKWQHRETLCARWMNDDSPAAPHPAPQRATDVYHEKAAVALKKAGLPPNHPRRQWPKSILLDLYHEMASETPADLLEREIWSSSPTPGEWWRKSVRFARSTAVMSMIGYVIGLGDRHLENILIEFTTGDLVHIDYNVCFEKGKRLRIPEIVPFRLSRNMLTSLGLTGVEGNFRIGCEQTMKVMRKNKEILVTLLEAFVYDPLVDWQIETTTVQGGVGVGGAGVVGFDSAQGSIREGHSGLILDSENESGSVSGTNIRDSRSSFDANPSTRASSIRRRLSNESLISVSSTSIKSMTTTDSNSKRWNSHAGDQVDSTSSSGTLSLLNQANQQQPQPSQHLQQQQQPPLHQRNVIAVNILRRVRHKLEGRDFEAGKKCKVPEQVDRVIQEATNVENLANMFEGWTPWL
ncbi:Serine/threonine-protein kinase smg1 [Mortierella polycephala]|uniref:non-specific serine/threonine protein kinase n=1 Tax=Mortierella polycephala TaxID=41804 RepID=A0A9P6PVE6_9FUNG|nr:Serine/threonine-protein kinase smg1 [Mortierella polycephala]